MEKHEAVKEEKTDDLEEEFDELLDLKGELELAKPERIIDDDKVLEWVKKTRGLVYNELDESGKGLFWVVNGNFTWEECKLASKIVTSRYIGEGGRADSPLVVLLPSNFLGEIRIMGLSEESSSTYNEITLGIIKRRGEREYTEYFDNIGGLSYIHKDLNLRGYIYDGIKQGNVVKVISERELGNGKKYLIHGAEVPFLNQLRGRNRKNITIKEPLVILHHAEEVIIPLSEVQTYPSLYTNINQLLPIDGWGSLEKNIVMATLSQFQELCPIGNLMVEGGTRLFKTTLLSYLSGMTGDKMHTAGQTTFRGFGVSYTTAGVPKAGLLFEADRVCLINEFFDFLNRYRSKHTDFGEMVASVLIQLKEILEHRPIHPRAGSQSYNDKRALQMRTPLISTTNRLDQVVLDALKVHSECLNRLQIIRLSNESIDAVRKYKAEHGVESENKVISRKIGESPLTPEQFQRFLDVIRGIPVKYDLAKVMTICNDYRAVLPENLKEWNIDELAEYYVQGLAKVDTILNSMALPEEIEAGPEVYDLLRKVLEKFIEDTVELFGLDLKPNVEEVFSQNRK